jgi:arginase
MNSMLKSEFSFIEAPLYQGQKKFGVCLGPTFIKQCLLDQGYNFEKLSLSVRQSQKNINLEAYEELSYLVEREVRRQKLTFIAGGDHSLALGSVQGLLRYNPNVKVLWIDAHGDINTRKTSLTGSYHGMPAAFLTGEDCFTDQPWFSEILKPENLIYFGVRDLDDAEKRFLDKKKIHYYTARDIKNSDLSSIVRQISADIKGSQLHLSVDSDAFDPEIAPSTGVPVLDGLDVKTVKELILSVQQVSDVISYEYVELNPQIFTKPEDAFQTAQIGIDLFNEVLKYKKQKEFYHGSNDRLSYSAGTHVLHRSFEMEEQNRF